MKETWGSTSIGILLLGMSACSPLDPIVIEPEMSDLQLTIDTLKTSLRDAQRTVAELRAEVDARRQELADVQIARAQLEGRIREAEHRLTEARHVIDLQREELANARSKREQAGRTRAALQNPRKPFQKQVSKVEEQVKGHVSAAAMAFPKAGASVFRGAAIQVSGTSSAGEAPMVSQSATVTPRVHVLVRPGDTLWSIARRYQTSVRRLMVLNALPSDRIQVGQALWLIEPPVEEAKNEPT